MRKLFESQRLQQILYVLWIFVCFALTVVVFAPGMEDNDTRTMISEAENGGYFNWQSVLMACTFNYVQVPGLSPYDLIFLFVIGGFWLSIACVVDSTVSGFVRKCLCAAVTGFFPPTVLLMICDNKDSVMCTLLFLSFASLTSAAKLERKLERILVSLLAAFFLLTANGVRHNALLASTPMCIWLARLWIRSNLKSKYADWVISICVGVFMSISFLSIDEYAVNKLIKAYECYPAQMLLAWDLTNISVKSHELLLPQLESNNKTLTLQDLEEHYYCEWSSDLLANAKYGFALTNRSKDFEALKASWPKAVLSHPLVYLEHRTKAFLSILGVINAEPQIAPFLYLIVDRSPGDPESRYVHSSFNEFLRKHVARPRLPSFAMYIPIAAPYLAIPVLYGLVLLSRVIAPIEGDVYLLSSALIYTSMFFFLSVGSDQRYLTYPIAVAGLVFARLIFIPRCILARRARN